VACGTNQAAACDAAHKLLCHPFGASNFSAQEKTAIPYEITVFTGADDRI
jgi:hypothetical protein